MPEHLIAVDYCYQFLAEQISMSLLLYSHLPAALFALIFSVFVLIKAKNRSAAMLLLTCLMFSLWSLADLGAWFVFLGSSNVMFSWSLLDTFAVTMFFFGYYFLYTFTTKQPLPLWQKITGLSLILPVAAIALIGLNISIYDLNSCVAYENTMYTRITYLIEALFLLAITVFTFTQYKQTEKAEERSLLLLASAGVSIFLLFFFSATFSVSLLAATDASTYVYNYLIYGLIGMPIFLVFLGYLIVHFKAFNLQMFSAQALILGLIALISSQLFFVSSVTVILLITLTLTLTCIGGFFMIKSVKKEITQREEIEHLANKLKKANKRLKVLDQMKSEFVSIASHQLRSPLTSIRGYTSMLLEGSYGKLSTKATKAIERIADSSTHMATSIEDYLNVSRIEAGNMKYELSDFNLKDEAEHVADDKRQEAMKKGLLITFKSDIDCQGIINADIGKTRQILHNILNNAINYTPRGTITLFVHDNQKKRKIYVDIIDSGIGMEPDELEAIFRKFERAQNVNEINVTGTGLGLFVARKMARKMNGEVTAHSDGVGHGSMFRLEMPLQM